MVASAFTKILEEYGDRVGKVFVADDLSHILTETIPESLLRLLGTENKYLIKASTGQGVCAQCHAVVTYGNEEEVRKILTK